MKNLLKLGVLGLIVAQSFVACGGSSKEDKQKQQKDAKKTKTLKKGVKVDPTAGCD